MLDYAFIFVVYKRICFCKFKCIYWSFFFDWRVEFLMPKITKICRYLSWIAINQSMTVLVFFCSLSCKCSRIFLFILSKIALLIFPSLFFAGLISLAIDWFYKFSLWPFCDMKQFLSLFFDLLPKNIDFLFWCCCQLCCTLRLLRRLVFYRIILLLSYRCSSFYLE